MTSQSEGSSALAISGAPGEMPHLIPVNSGEDAGKITNFGRPEPRVYVIVLNWNGWRYTIPCLESVIRLSYSNICIIVCDNGSTDDSVLHILNWAKTELPGRTDARARMSSMVIVDAGEAGRAGPSIADGNLILLRIPENLGFAGGNNAGLEFALARGDLDYAWLLNNDTVVESRSLDHLVEKMHRSPGVGICGSTLLYDDDPATFQVRGATYNKWLGRTRLLGSVVDTHSLAADEDEPARRSDYVVGASMLVSRSFLRDVGLMSDEYFLYFEELDWTLRAGPAYGFAQAPRSIVHHKGGAATGATRSLKSATGAYYGTRSRILFTRKFYPYAFPTVIFAILLSALTQLVRGQFKIGITMLIGANDGLHGRTGVRPSAEKRP